MAPLAIYLKEMGHFVSGTDASLREPVAALFKERNIAVLDPEDIPVETEWVVFSSAVAEHHPLLSNARRHGFACFRRGELLAHLSRETNLIAICGSHGKTSTSGMLITALKSTGFQFDYVLGGLFTANQMPPAQYNQAPWLVAEVDESDGTIDHFSPAITVALNLDWDHADRYHSHEALRHAFQQLINRTTQAVLLPQDSQKEVHPPVQADLFSFGKEGDYRYAIEREGNGELLLKLSGEFPLHQAHVKALGEFNAVNACAALAVCNLLNLPMHRHMLQEYPGIARRQEIRFSSEKLLVMEDYAHHPTEIEALMNHLRRNFSDRVLTVVFQPHRYSRTVQFAKQFAEVLRGVDRLALLPVYPAAETPVKEGRTEAIIKHFPENQQPFFAETQAALFQWLKHSPSHARELLVFIGAGDIERSVEAYCAGLQSASPAKLSHDLQWWEELKHLVSSQTLLSENEPLASKTTMRVGGKASFYCEPVDLRDLCSVLRAASRAHIPFFYLGRGSNLIVMDSGFDGLIIRLSQDNWKQVRILNDSQVYAGAGARLKQLCAQTAAAGMSGFEFLEGIPGTVGGSLRMNAGAMGHWLFDVVEELHLVTPKGEFKKLKRPEIHASYRNCSELNENFAVGAILRAASKEQVEQIRTLIQQYSEKRKQSQPREPSAGCIFKNPENGHAGRMIDESGLKGSSVGGALVSPVHANFIVNQGNATASDIIDLVRKIRETVKQAKGVDLEPEVRLLGAEWKDVL